MERTIEFVSHDEFDHDGFDKKLMAMRPESLDRSVSRLLIQREPGIAFVSGLVNKPLLTPDEERYLFLRMNSLKSRAERNRRMLDLRKPDSTLVEQIDLDLDQALCVRNQIIEGNLRLIVAIARKLSGSLDRMSELISEGMAPLIRSVELFDIGLGFRFSTYATWAVRNQMLRRLKRIALTPEYSPGEDAPSLENLPDKRTSFGFGRPTAAAIANADGESIAIFALRAGTFDCRCTFWSIGTTTWPKSGSDCRSNGTLQRTSSTDSAAVTGEASIRHRF